MIEKEHIVETLRQYFARRDDTTMAFLFGSVASGITHSSSDVDVSVYLKNEEMWENIWNELEDLLGVDVNVVVLNNAAPVLAWTSIRCGIPLKIEDRTFFLDFMLEVSREAEDFLDFNIDAFKRRYVLAKS